MSKRFTILWSLLLVLGLAACGGRASQEASGSDEYDLSLNPMSTAVGETVLMFTLNDKEGQPVNNATLDIKGDMNHAGMQPVLGKVTQGVNGVYAVPFEWTMGGDWYVTVDVTLADGTTFSQRFEDLQISSQMSGQMDVMNVWGRPTLAGNNTAFYMNLSNGTTTADALVSAAVPVCETVELHETYDRGEGVMGMRPVENGRIPLTSGGMAQLKPGGLHVMCIVTTQDLAIGDEIEVTLDFEEAGEIVVTAEIADPTTMMDSSMSMEMGHDEEHSDEDHADHDHDDEDHADHDHDEHQMEMKTIPNNGAVITILAPANGATFDHHDHITIEVATENFDLSQDGNHWHIYLNDEAHEMVEGGATSYDLHDLEAGEYVVKVTMSNADHDELEEGASVTITVE
jgi:copper(I)-binding protein